MKTVTPLSELLSDPTWLEKIEPAAIPALIVQLAAAPKLLPGRGVKRVVAFAACADCAASTFVRYGPTPLCEACARRREVES